MNKESEIRELICKYGIDIENEHEFIEELKGICNPKPEPISEGGQAVVKSANEHLDYLVSRQIHALLSRKPKKRYFIVCAAGDKTNFIFGVVTEGSYVSFENIDSAYRKSFKGSKMIVTPTNIIELNESDYNDWIK